MDLKRQGFKSPNKTWAISNVVLHCTLILLHIPWILVHHYFPFVFNPVPFSLECRGASSGEQECKVMTMRPTFSDGETHRTGVKNRREQITEVDTCMRHCCFRAREKWMISTVTVKSVYRKMCSWWHWSLGKGEVHSLVFLSCTVLYKQWHLGFYFELVLLAV